MANISKSKKLAKGKADKPAKKQAKSGSTGAASHGLSFRQLAKIETRRKLIAAARKLFVEHGYHGTRPQDIAKAAGLGYGTFYDNFKDKMDCYSAFIDDAGNELNKVLAWYWPTDELKTPADYLTVMQRIMFDYSAINPGVVEEIVENNKILSDNKKDISRGGERLVRQLKHWQSTGAVAKDFDSELFAYLISGIIKLGAGLVARHPKKQDQITEGLTRFIVHAMDGAQPAPVKKSKK